MFGSSCISVDLEHDKYIDRMNSAYTPELLQLAYLIRLSLRITPCQLSVMVFMGRRPI